MFSLPAEPNQLNNLLSGIANTLGQDQIQQNRFARKNEAVKNAFKQLNDESSPLDFYKAISGIPGLDAQERKELMDIPELMTKHTKANQEKRIKAQKAEQDKVQEQQEYATIEKTFGKSAADLWRASPVGAKTKLIEQWADPLFRESMTKEDFERILSGEKKREDLLSQPGSVEKNGMNFPPVKPPQDLRPKDRPAYRENRRKENVPHINDARDKLKSFNNEKTYIGQLKRLAPKLPKGLGRIMINPQTGEPYKAAQLIGKVNAATQLFLKTINDFTTKAKDSFGARVTNFDLERFMARLPSLLNTPEGIAAILDQMEIVNEINSLHEDALLKTYAHYGAGNITLEEADEIVRANIEPQLAVLDKRLASLVDRLDEEEFANEGNQNEFDELPAAARYAGQEIESDTGEVFRSDGKNWIKVR